MRLILFSFLFVFFISSCIKQHGFPEKNSIRISNTELLMATDITNVQSNESPINKRIQDLQSFVNLYEEHNVTFNLVEFENTWGTVLKEKDNQNWNESNLIEWVRITGLLLEITGHAKYAEELENLSGKESLGLQKVITPFILSKKLDHIYVNLFEPVEINYLHSMKGEVKIRQETNYPKSGSVKLYFGMTERRHIELFIRIPSWAEGTTVTVKQVKYFASPGSYCKIVKKWKEGDLVEIEFPIDLRPRHAELVSASLLEDSEILSD